MTSVYKVYAIFTVNSLCITNIFLKPSPKMLDIANITTINYIYCNISGKLLMLFLLLIRSIKLTKFHHKKKRQKLFHTF